MLMTATVVPIARPAGIALTTRVTAMPWDGAPCAGIGESDSDPTRLLTSARAGLPSGCRKDEPSVRR